ncbi:hemolysin III family protein [Chryseolinea sp. T2]|uniref:PAQR family membrane homeostasis protein TrhA n=1 Tax=Chryseolinea sp. T2 TaxID=3129255 RepID=UPI003076FB28
MEAERLPNTADQVSVTEALSSNKRSVNGEEIANAVSHGIGTALAIAGLVLLVVQAAIHGNAWHVTSFTIFGSSMVILYAASTLYHSFVHPGVKRTFRKFDHMSIYLLIAGTYTPFCLTLLNGWIGWSVFGTMWGCAVLGIVFKAIHTGRAEVLSTILYLIMGWAVVIFIKPVYDGMSSIGFTWLLLGGAAYSIGVIFFLLERMKYSHSIWHLFVIGGSVFHFFSVLTLLPPQ